MAADISATILVIDDEPSIVRVLAQLLRRDDRVETAANGQHALTQLHTQPYDVIVSDLHMPDLDGRAFYTLLQHQYPALCQRVIFLTGNGDAADSATFLAQCGQPWLPKPCPIAVLRRTIQQVLAAAVAAPSCAQARRAAHARSQQLSHTRPCADGVNACWGKCRPCVPRVRTWTNAALLRSSYRLRACPARPRAC